MPRTGERRAVVALRLGRETIAGIDQRAKDEDVMLPRGEPNRSEMLRIAWAYADKHMPQGWRPGTDSAHQAKTNH